MIWGWSRTTALMPSSSSSVAAECTGAAFFSPHRICKHPQMEKDRRALLPVITVATTRQEPTGGLSGKRWLENPRPIPNAYSMLEQDRPSNLPPPSSRAIRNVNRRPVLPVASGLCMLPSTTLALRPVRMLAMLNICPGVLWSSSMVTTVYWSSSELLIRI